MATTLPPPPPSIPLVKPVLATTLLSDEDLDSLVDGLVNGYENNSRTESRKRDGTLETGVKAVDEVLEGGLRCGRIVGVSGEVGNGGGASELCLTLLTTSLLSSPTSLAAIIDTTGNLDVLHIYSLLITKIRKNEHITRTKVVTDESMNLSVEDVAAKVLERVKIMRVFDFEGVVEAIGEIREGLEGAEVKGEEKGISLPDENPAQEHEVVEQSTEAVAAPQPAKKTEIADSEDEDEEDEMLFDAPDATTLPIFSFDGQTEPDYLLLGQEEAKPAEEGKITFILIDNLAHVVNPLLKKDYVSTTANSTTLLSTLSYLTRTRNLHTILVNPALVLPRASTSSPSAPPATKNPDPNVHVPATQTTPDSKPQPPQPPSMFSSIFNVPALSHILPRYLDMHLLVSTLPKRKTDAKIFYADASGGALRRVRKDVEIPTVVEILADRHSEGFGAWGAFPETAR